MSIYANIKFNMKDGYPEPILHNSQAGEFRDALVNLIKIYDEKHGNKKQSQTITLSGEELVEFGKHYADEVECEPIAFLTIIQDVYNQKEQLEVNQERLDIACHLDDYLKIYFKTYTNTNIMEISEYADNWITDEAVDFMPEIIFGDYYYPRTIENIKIIKDGKVYVFDKNQSEEDIKAAQQYVINWLKESA